MAQPVIPPTPPVQQAFQPAFQAQNEPLTQKPHQQVKFPSYIVFVALIDM
jgi:arginine/serine-rich splicing factor 15